MNGNNVRRSFEKSHAHTRAPLLAEMPPGAVIHSDQVVQASGDVVRSASPELQGSLMDGERPLTVPEVARVVHTERRRAVASLARRYPTRGDAEDIFGEATLRLFTKLTREGLGFSSARPLGWLHVSARFVLLEKYRSTDALDHLRGDSTSSDGTPALAIENAEASAFSIEGQLAARQQLILLAAGLSPSDLQLLRQGAVADREGSAVDQCQRRRLCRARQRARQLLSKAERPAAARSGLSARRTTVLG